MKGFIEVSANHICGIVCVVGTVCGIPFFYNLISGFDLNTDMARTLVTVVGVLISGVSFALGWNQRNMSVRREISEIESDHADALKEKEATIAGKEATIAGKEAAIQREKEKNAELAARWEKLNSEERRKRKAFDVLNDRERWLLAAILDMSPMVPSSNDNKIVPYLRSMCSEGILLDTGTVTVKGVKKESYVISVGWRKWLADHADELPDPHSDMPE